EHNNFDVVSKSVHWEHHEIYQTGKYYVGHNVFTGTGTINVRHIGFLM
ncbi:unnamed protein product, partial [marine sediment metagenome]